MTDSNSTALRGALARAIKSHVEMKGLNGVQAAKECGIANSRMSTILRGQVEKISSDALVDILGTLGYRLDSVIGATEGHEFTLTLDEGLGLPKDIDAPINPIEALRPHIEEYAETYGIEVDHDSIDAAVQYVEQDADPDADRVIADE